MRLRSQTRGRWLYHESLISARTKHIRVYAVYDISHSPRWCPETVPLEEWMETDNKSVFYQTSRLRDVGWLGTFQNDELVALQPVRYDNLVLRILGSTRAQADVILRDDKHYIKVRAEVDRDLDFHPPK